MEQTNRDSNARYYIRKHTMFSKKSRPSGAFFQRIRSSKRFFLTRVVEALDRESSSILVRDCATIGNDSAGGGMDRLVWIGRGEIFSHPCNCESRT